MKTGKILIEITSEIFFFREKTFKQSLVKLREEVAKANALVQEANVLAQEMGKRTEFHVTLQIPACNLSPNRRVSINCTDFNL